jgi:hypothetical protein
MWHTKLFISATVLLDTYAISGMLEAGEGGAHPVFGISVNPISIGGGANYALPITICPPGFSDLATFLVLSRPGQV